MEKDVFVGHGTSLLLKERFGADATNIKVDDEGNIGYYDRQEDEFISPSTHDGEFDEAEIPHAFLLLLNELKSMMMDSQFEMEEK